jgi:hypothetical protein
MVHKTQKFNQFLCSRSACTAMQRFFEENYRKNLSLKFIHINNVTHLIIVTIKTEDIFRLIWLRKLTITVVTRRFFK